MSGSRGSILTYSRNAKSKQIPNAAAFEFLELAEQYCEAADVVFDARKAGLPERATKQRRPQEGDPVNKPPALFRSQIDWLPKTDTDPNSRSSAGSHRAEIEPY